MTALSDYQFEVLPSAEASDGFVFGIGADVSISSEDGFDPGDQDWLSQDQDNSRRGNKAFGRDVKLAKTWTWSSHVNMDDADGALAVLEDFSGSWSPDEVEQPNWQTAIRYRIGGRYRRVFGRPRRFSAPPSNLILGGYVPVTHDFQCVDALTYDDVASSVNIPYLSAATGGGFSYPTKFPVSTQASDGSGNSQISVGGSARTYPVIRFNGPWNNPVIRTDNWELAWTGVIPANSWIEIDCRPWALTVFDKSGASRPAGLSRSTYLEDMWFAPGSVPQISLGGSAASGGASAQVSWRNAWKSI